MKLMTTALIILLSFSICLGQTNSKPIRTETISYKKGIATFQCYEDSKTSNLIKHGTFSFSEIQKGEFGSQVATITGQFNDGYRDGLWSYTIKKIDAENLSGTYTTGTLISIQNFNNGFPDGVWSLNNNWKTRSRIMANFKSVWSVYSNSATESASCSFKKGILVGVISFTENGKQKVINLNKDGFVTGPFIEESGGTSTEMNFNSKGVMTKYVERVSGSGTVLNSIDFDAELLQLADDYLSNRKSIADLKELSIKLDTIKGIAEDAGLMFYTDYFYLPGIDGDKTITQKGNERIHGRYLKFERIKIVPYEEHSKWPRKYSGYSDTKSKIASYTDFLTYHGSEVSKQDNATIQQLIKEAENELKSVAIQRDAQSQYDELYEKLKEKITITPKASKTDGLEPFSVATHDFSHYTKSVLGKYSNNAKNMFFSYKFSKSDFTYQGFKGKENDYIASLKLLQEYSAFLNKKRLNIDSLSTLITWINETTFNVNEIECKYIINQDLSSFNTYSNDSPRQTQKPKLYNPYLNVFTNLLRETDSSSTFNDYYKNIKMLNDICWYMNNALDTKTSDIEKELKTTVDYKVQLAVFEKAFNSSNFIKN